jgi:branched-chain amino acid transport system permease protein
VKVHPFLRPVIAGAAAAVVSWPIVGFNATVEGGPILRFGPVEPALRIGLLVLILGIVYSSWLRLCALVSRTNLPGNLAHITGNVALRRKGLAVLLLVLAVAPLLTRRHFPLETGYWTGIAVETMVLIIIALGLNISMGMAGLLVLGHAAFWAVGAYTFTMLTIHAGWNFWLAFPAGGAAAAVTGLLLGIPSLRLRGDYLAIVTLGFGETIRNLIENNQGWTGGTVGIPNSKIEGSMRTSQGFLGEYLWQPGAGSSPVLECYWFALALLVLCVLCISLLTRSRFGRALFAMREDETAARCMGIDTTKVKLIAFMASAMWAGLAGAIDPIYRTSITPSLFDFHASVLCVAVVVLGGLGSIPGTIFAAILLNVLPMVLRNWFPDFQNYRMLLYGAIMVGIMVVRPEGFFGRSAAGSAEDETPDPADDPSDAERRAEVAGSAP